MWLLTASTISVSLLFLDWIKNKWRFIVSLNQCCIIQHLFRDMIKSFHFLSSSKMINQMKFYRLSHATYDRINAIYQFIKPLFDKYIYLIFRNMEL